MVFRRSRLVALACGVVVLATVGACGTGDTADEQPPVEAVANPYLRGNTCTPDGLTDENVDPARRLTELSRTAGELLLVNGIVPGPDLAVDGQLTSSQAADRASTVPGDASIAEALWIAAPSPDTGLDPIRDTADYYAADAQHISTFEVTEQSLNRMLGPNWSSVIEVVEEFAGDGYEQYVEAVRDAPPMRASDAAAIRAQLRAAAVDAGLESQWETAQSIVPIYFQSCTSSSDAAGHDVDLSSSVLGEILAADAVGAAFAETIGPSDSTEPLALGLQIVLGTDPNSAGDSQLTKNYDPNEILSPEDVDLMEAEEPSLDGP
ncbi:hypothetical protein [Rhodococcoides yunnanense]|uniref:Uncharacterized protein n=1 Tax=Rhodococcoides yunnanense TaxID=278209 RepID=A0ABU4BA13_9NOCA|nr:hypothetical protein [Rhodococcus yunnanensis]MDV6261029.1 hypothetical protein [Rhodococcus yunnanensis]